MKFVYDPRKKRLTLTWELELYEAEGIGYALVHAGLGPKGEIRDRGFYEDGTALLEAVFAVDDDEESDSPGLRIGVVDAG